ncbi:hypothetical protein GDO81_006052 [Engystomops pustulosus]|uniref:Uncharacterized protein n=1 Tax=Engystomops pustulosus TaxID=76066 RepID=A0AAV7CVZ9_ENGPU|nr:hypothetical protein GDO81_006052 [Engystomops pustulosus]
MCNPVRDQVQTKSTLREVSNLKVFWLLFRVDSHISTHCGSMKKEVLSLVCLLVFLLIMTKKWVTENPICPVPLLLIR